MTKNTLDNSDTWRDIADKRLRLAAATTILGIITGWASHTIITWESPTMKDAMRHAACAGAQP